MSAASSPSALGRFISFLKRPQIFRTQHVYQRELLFFAALGLSVFYYLSLFSFTPLDESWFSVSFPNNMTHVINWAGQVGAYVSGLVLFALGLSAWLLPLPLLYGSMLLLRNKPHAFSRSRTLGWVLLIAMVASFLTAFYPQYVISSFEFPSGGVVGVTLFNFAVSWLGEIGSFVVLGTVSICALLLVLRRSILNAVFVWLTKPLSLLKQIYRESRKPVTNVAVEVISDASSENTSFTPTVVNTPAIDPSVEKESFLRELFPKKVGSKDNEENRDVAIFESESSEENVRGDGDYLPPPTNIFQTSNEGDMFSVNAKELEITSQLLLKTFEDFGVLGKIIGHQPGPVVTVYEFQPDAGIKQSKVLGLIDDLALALKVDSIFIHPVQGKRALGIQVPNSKREIVHFGDIVSNASFKEARSPLTFGMGKMISGHPICADLTEMPHLLVAGATGSGKSVAINTLLCSVIMKSTPKEVRMILVDPKMLELSVYDGIPHLLMPVITEPGRASLALKWAANEMERRYKLMQLACVRNIAGFNAFWDKASADRKDQIRTLANDETIARLPYIMLVIDELADLMMTAPKDVESSIQRLAQKARASGIHMVLATQRPSVDIITGVIKANLPCRIAFQVVSKHDSRTILDLIGAEKLLGKGDMLLQRPGVGRLERIQGAFISDEEVLNMVASVKSRSQVVYDESIINWIDDEAQRQVLSQTGGGQEGLFAAADDPKYDEAIGIAKAHGVVSASFLQRHLKIGYNRAARIVEFMEGQGLVDKADGSKPRKWLGAS